MARRSAKSSRTKLIGALSLALLFTGLALAAAPPSAPALPGEGAVGLNRATSAFSGAAGVAPGARKPPHRDRQSRGIVQAVLTRGVVLKQLDGSTLTVPVDRKTRVFVDGRRARLADVEPGFLAVVVWRAGTPARELKTFSILYPPPAAPAQKPFRTPRSR